MNFEKSLSQYGDKLTYIARDRFGKVRFRESTPEKLEKAIQEFNKLEASGKIKVKFSDELTKEKLKATSEREEEPKLEEKIDEKKSPVPDRQKKSARRTFSGTWRK